QPEMVVVPHGPRGHTDDRGEFSDPHAPSRNVDAAARSTGHRRTAHGGSSSTWTPPTSSGPLIRGVRGGEHGERTGAGTLDQGPARPVRAVARPAHRPLRPARVRPAHARRVHG